MEQKKLLWIIFSVTLFLVVVVGAGFIWFYPGEDAEYAESPSETGQQGARTEFDPIEWVRTSDEYPGLEDKEEDEEDEGFVVVYGENGDEKEPSGEKPPAGEPEEKEAGKKTGAPESGTKREAEEPVKTGTSGKPAASKTEPEPEPAEKTYAGTKKKIRTVEYWIQAGSYTSKSRAESVRERLAEKGFASRVEAKDVGGTLYYRVRIGPYINEAEADKFLTWVKDIKDFEKSYVSKVYRTKVVEQ